MKISNIFNTLVFLSLLISCNTNNYNTKSIVVDFDKATDYMELTEYFESQIVLLEKNEKCLIGEINKVISAKGKLFVLDESVAESLYIFDQSGRFIRKIGDKGKGFGEYLYIESFDVVNDYIYLLSGLDQKLIVYDFDGNVIKEIRLDDHGGSELNVYGNGSFFTIRSNSLLSVYFWNKEGKIKNSIIDEESTFIKWETDKGISHVGESIFICPIFDDVIYKVENKQVMPCYSFDFGEKNYPLDKLKSMESLRNAFRSMKYITTCSFVMSKDFIMLHFLSDYYPFGLYLINQDEIKITKYPCCNYIPLISPAIGEIKDGAIYSADPSLIHLMIEKNDPDVFPNELKNVKPDDNPVLFILKQKEGIFNIKEE